MDENITAKIESAIADAEKSKKVNWNKLDMPIEYNGRAITLPADPAKMPLRAAYEALGRKIRDEETQVQVYELIEGYPLDAGVAFVKAMVKLYGWASPQAIQGQFGSQRPPVYRPVKVGLNKEDVIQVPFGAFKLPGIDDNIQTEIAAGPNGPAFVIHAVVKQRERHILIELATETRRFLEEESIYRGKAIRLRVNDEGELDINTPPEFMDTSMVGEANLIFSPQLSAEIYDNILVPIKHSSLLKKHKESLKRTVLLEGPYGTGKTMIAAMVAAVCEQEGKTFVLLDRVQGLKAALTFVKRVDTSAVVFAEDIDRVATERDEEMNDLINTIDGVVSKTSQIMTILTTNHADKLHPVILRPGRLDAVISLRAPDRETVKRLLKHYAGKLLPDDADLTLAASELAGQIPASIAECVKRAKLGMIGRGDNKLNDNDIFTAARTMKNHLALLNRDEKDKPVEQVLAESLKKVIHNGTGEKLDNMERMIDEVHSSVC